AKAHEEEDKKKKEEVEARNQLDSLIYTVEKAVKDYGAKVSEDEKKKVDTALEKAKKALSSNDTNEMKSAAEELQKASYKLSEEMYKSAQGAQQGAEAGQGAAGPGQEQQQGGGAKEDVMDADYKVDDEKGK
ncbi:MAG: Hsp70 family protein, partial [Candidatus Omnitrophica bacterium]|nr:Hsp70 family protein [Candidatus Omnitrophota bacterium]